MAEDYAGKDDETRATDCKTKYSEALEGYEALSDSQKELFDTGAAYKDAREAYAIWEGSAANEDPEELFGRQISNDNFSAAVVIAITTIAVIGSAAFFLRKRKEN